MIALLVMSLLGQSYYSPEEARGVFQQAAMAYAQGDLDAAATGFQKLIDHGSGSAEVLYNRGTVALAQGQLGQAVLFLERARRADPSSEDIEANLAVARSRQLDQVVGQGGGTFLQRLVEGSSATALGWTFAALWTAGFLALIARRLMRHRPALLGWVALGCFAFALVPGAAFAAHVFVRETYREAVVLDASVPAQEVPSVGARAAFEIHAGLKVRVLAENGAFWRIRLPNGLEGWVPASGLGGI